ncbi:MAG: cardiolipin synthase [Verrucomicrobiota bacterium]
MSDSETSSPNSARYWIALPKKLISLCQGSRLASWCRKHRRSVVTGVVVFAHTLGALTSVKALFETRTPQGTLAWVISLNTLPYVAVPAYWVFGRSSFNGYVSARQAEFADLDPLLQETYRQLIEDDFLLHTEQGDFTTEEKIARLPYTRFNDVELLIDGEATFDSIIESISQAKDYILVQFYIIRNDDLGNRLRDALLERAAAGVRVYFIYDEIGSYQLPTKWLNDCREGGIDIRPFNTRQGHTNRFQLNFRNHRKVVIIDGKTGFVGGHNVGDEYLGLSEKFGHWRDTHVKFEGPVVLATQVAFMEDWNWAADSIPVLNWTPQRAENGDVAALSLPTGPSDEVESCTLFFLHTINSAQDRLWIASPYFVPDEQIMSALQLAALRGVDVRIMLPEDPDHLLVYLSSFSYLPTAERAGIKIYRYGGGFLHQKAMLVDDRYSAIGTANFDNRSFRLNFEITMLFDDPTFNEEVEKMFLDDFEDCRLLEEEELTERSFGFRFLVKCSRLLDPIQ